MKILFIILFFPLIVFFWVLKAVIGLILLGLLFLGVSTSWKYINNIRSEPAAPRRVFETDHAAQVQNKKENLPKLPTRGE